MHIVVNVSLPWQRLSFEQSTTVDNTEIAAHVLYVIITRQVHIVRRP